MRPSVMVFCSFQLNNSTSRCSHAAGPITLPTVIRSCENPGPGRTRRARGGANVHHDLRIPMSFTIQQINKRSNLTLYYTRLLPTHTAPVPLDGNVQHSSF